MSNSPLVPVVNGVEQSSTPPPPPSLPKELLGNASWIFVVYCAFNAGWKPWEIIALVLALVPISLLGGRPKRG